MRIYKNNLFFQVALLMLVVFLPQQLMAARPNAGGADKIEGFDSGKFWTSTAISLGSMYVGGAIASGLDTSISGSFSQKFMGSLSSGASLSNFGGYLSTSAVLQQTGSLVGAIGSYYDWSPKTTMFVSSIAQGMGGGMMNPNSVLPIQGPGGTLIGGQSAVNNGLLTRAMLGATKGAIEGGILTAFADDKGGVKPWVGPLAGLTGSFGIGVLAGGGGLNSGISNAASDIPNLGVQLGVNYLTEGKKWQDAQIIHSAFLGAYPVANALATNLQRELDKDK